MPPTVPYPCRLFLFDLDGTLIDSKTDIARSVNLALARLHLPGISESRIIDFVGDGVHKLMERSLREATGRSPSADEVALAAGALMKEYGNHLMETTRLYPSVRETLDNLGWGIFGVVSNKPEALSRSILTGLGLAERFRVILGGDSLPQHKPDPAPLREAMERCGVPPDKTAMIGDSPSDILAGKAAGVVTCGVLGGFRGRRELLQAGCDFLVESLGALPALFRPP